MSFIYICTYQQNQIESTISLILVTAALVLSLIYYRVLQPEYHVLSLSTYHIQCVYNKQKQVI